MYWHSLVYVGDTCVVETLLTVNTNADPTSPISAKRRWNIDECYEIILLLKAKAVLWGVAIHVSQIKQFIFEG